MGSKTKFNEPADALVSNEELVRRRAGRDPLSSPIALPPGAAVCPYNKDVVCKPGCGGRGYCLDVA